MRIVVYLCSLILTIALLALALELGLKIYLPDAYRGYLIEEGKGKVKWAIGPFEPSEPATGFNPPIEQKKPDDVIRIVALGASGTEGWLSAKTVFKKYGLRWEPKSLSSYSRAIEYSMNQIAGPSSKRVEVINLGVAAYNISDVIRMLKDSLKLEPDLLLVQVGGNETWTSERTTWSARLNNDIPYLYTELAYEILSDTQAGWRTLSGADDAFNPLALFSAGPQPVVIEPPGRLPGLQPRLENFRQELTRLTAFLKNKGLPTVFLIPSQNIADYAPFASMAKAGTDDEQLARLNELLIDALENPLAQSKDAYQEILALDDGIAEANFQIGRIYLQENKTDLAREHFWKANDRDLVLKRLPGGFHDISREILREQGFLYLDSMKFYESKSSTGLVGYNWLDDDVHPNRRAQFDLGNEIIKIIMESGLLAGANYSGDLQRLPSFEEYNQSTGFDQEAAGSMAYLKGAHNFLTFGRFRQRMRWDPRPEIFLDPILDDLYVANRYADIDQSRYLSSVLNLFLGRQEQAQEIIGAMECRSSEKRAAQVNRGSTATANTVFGYTQPKIKDELQRLLIAEGCAE